MVNESVTASAKLGHVDDAFNSNSAVVFKRTLSERALKTGDSYSFAFFPAGSSNLMLNRLIAGRRFVETGFDEGSKVIAVSSLFHLLDRNETKRSGIDAVTKSGWRGSIVENMAEMRISGF